MGKNEAMNADLMIDYVLGRLDGPDRDRVAEAFRSDPELSARADRLGQVVNLLLDDGDNYEPSPGLTHRTLSLVAASRSRPGRCSITCRSGFHSAGQTWPWPPASSSPACSP